MPLKVNIGLSRKVADASYGSRGASVNVEAELDSSLIGEPQKFQERIRQLYGLVRTSLNEELNCGGNGTNGHATNGNQNGNGNNGHATNGNGNNGSNANGSSQRTRPITQSQVKAIHAIARNQRLDLFRYLSEHHHVNRPEDLDIKTASQVIDALKSQVEEGGHG